MPIRRLPPLVVNQIAAGEVIERPASVVKELLENSIDAAATRIDIAIENGGIELIRVTDNGCGIAFDDLSLALAPHATSKITSTADLDAIGTMGFRGEALASIVSVSRLSMITRPAGEPEGRAIEAAGDQSKPPHPVGAPHGTTMTVRNLFFNTPARRKFLRTEQTESTRVGETVQSLAMSHPSIAFTLTQNGRKTIDLPPDQAPRDRVIELVGRELEPELLEVQNVQGDAHIWGLAGTPAIARGTARQMRIYLNGRPISDRSLNHAMREAYRGLIDPARYPTLVLFLEMPPSQADVNVHPSKLEVRFRNGTLVHGLILSAVRTALRKADLTPALELSGPGAAAMAVPVAPPSEFASGLERASAQTADRPSAKVFVDYFRRLDPKQKGFVFAEVKQALARDMPEIVDGTPAESTEMLSTIRSVQDVMQVHSSYIVTQDEQGILIIDQHALHERVMFEKLVQQVSKGNLESQRLLMPAMVEVSASQLEALPTVRALLEKIGIEAEPLGPRTLAVHAFPSFLFERGVEPQGFVSELLDRAAGNDLPADSEAALHETLDMMACKAAVKAGDRLTPAELAELLKHRELVERSSNCPHGRPTTLRLSLRDLERQFGRR